MGLALNACNSDEYLSDLYVTPNASFSVDKTEVDVFEKIVFSKKGAGQYYSVYPGDNGHVYGAAKNTGFAVSDYGDFSYMYQEPGTFNAVWVATSVNKAGEVEQIIDSLKITVKVSQSGMSEFSLYNIGRISNVPYTAYGKYVNDTTIVCAIPYDFFPTQAVDNPLFYFNREKYLDYELESDFATLYWEDIALLPRNRYKRVAFMENTNQNVSSKVIPRTFTVHTSTGTRQSYHVGPVIIPQFTSFSINTYAASAEDFKRSLNDFSTFEVTVHIPAGTPLKNLTPAFQVLHNDPNLVSGNILAGTSNAVVYADDMRLTTGSKIKLSDVDTVAVGQAVFTIDYHMLNHPQFTHSSTVLVKVIADL